MTLLNNKLFLSFAACVALFAIYAWVVEPLELRRGDLEAKLQIDRKRLTQIVGTERELAGLTEADSAPASTEKLPAGFSLFGFLEEAARRTGVYQSLDSIRPDEKILDNGIREQTVSMRLRGIPLRSMVEFLFNIESNKAGIRIQRLAVRVDQRAPEELNLDLTASVYRR